MVRTRFTSLTVVSLFSLTGMASAIAQVNNPPSADKVALEEVIVTAQRREQSLEDVPIAITALSGKALAQAGVDSFEDLESAVTGLQINSFAGYVMPFIRGVGSLVQGPSAVSSVAVYIDDVYSARSLATTFEMDNIAGVEVLKGPQSTLYGRNSTGGTIKVATATTMPGDEAEANLKATFGNYDERRYSAYASGSLGEMVGANIAVYQATHDGYTTGLQARNGGQNLDYFGAPADQDGQAVDSTGIAVKLAFTPTDKLQIITGYRQYDQKDTTGYGSRNLDPDATNAALLALFGMPADYSGVEYGKSYLHRNAVEATHSQATVNVTYAFESFDLSYIAGYATEDYQANIELFGASFPINGFAGDFKNDAWSNEIRAVGTWRDNWNWIVGLAHFQEGTDGHPDRQFADSLNPLTFSYDRRGQAFTDWETEAASVYSDATYTLNSATEITFGLRYTEETFEATNRNGDFNPLDPNDGLSRDSDHQKLDYRLVINHQIEDFGMVYGSISTGFKSGQVNTSNVNSPLIEPEEIQAFEIGTKGTYMDDRLRLNTAAFYSKLDDYQVLRISLGTGAQVAVNADEVVSYGLESDFQFAASHNLTINGGVTWVPHSEYEKFEDAGDPLLLIGPLDASGNRLAASAEIEANLGAEYSLPVSDRTEIAIGGFVNYNSGVFYDAQNTMGSGGLDDSAYTLVNASIAWRELDGDWSVTLWANNLTDEEYVTAGLNVADGVVKSGLDAAPATYGVTFQKRF